MLKGFVIDNKRLIQQNNQLKELQNSVKILGDSLKFISLTNDESIGLLKIISQYAYALDILDQYDCQSLEIKNTSGKEIYQLTYEEAITQIKLVKTMQGNSDLFGHEKMIHLKALYQLFIKLLMGLICIQALRKKLQICCIL